MSIQITKIAQNKWDYLPLLLLGDEQENMIARYLDRGALFALHDGGVLCTVCVVTDEGGGIFEIKNLATAPEHQRKGYGAAMLRFVREHYQNRGTTLLVGTGESPLTVPFYQHCGFVYSHRIADFFTTHYDHPILEAGVQLTDMVYFKLPLKGEVHHEL